MLWQSCDNVVTMLWQCCDPRFLASVRTEDGWILPKFFFCPGNKNANKKTENNVQPSWPNKDLSYGQKRTFAEFRFEKNTCYVVKMLWQRCDNVVTRADKGWAVKRALRSSFNVWCGVGLARALFPRFRCAWRPAKFSFLETGNPIFFL